MPILRPLLTYDKQEIVDLAKIIGTYERSIEFYKDCCAMVSRFPKTLSDHATLTALEQKVLPDYEGLIQQTLADRVCLAYKCGRQVD